MLADLPPDLLFLIVGYFPETSDRRNFIYTCRRFYELLLPKLYYKAAPGQLPKAQQDQITDKPPLRCGCRGLRSFIQAILRRADLARAVRHLQLDYCEKHSLHPSPTRNIEHNPTRELMEAVAADSHSKEEQEMWESDLAFQRLDAWVALLLPRLSNLRSLKWHFAVSTGTYFLTMIERAKQGAKPFDKEPAFRYLEEVVVTSHRALEDDDGPLGWVLPDIPRWVVTPFFSLPSVRRLAVLGGVLPVDKSNGDVNDNRLAFRAPPERSSSVTELELMDGVLLPGAFGLIKYCKELRSFKYTQGSGKNRKVPTIVSFQQLHHHLSFDPIVFWGSLALAKDTLEDLWLEVHHGVLDEDGYPAGEGSGWPKIGNLRHFPRLRTLRIDPVPPTHHFENEADRSRTFPALEQFLPSSMETLTVGCDKNELGWFADHLSRVFPAAELPNLKTIELEADYFHVREERMQSRLMSARARCAEAQVEFEVRCKFLGEWVPSFVGTHMLDGIQHHVAT